MNIFYLSHDVEECVKYHVDRHVVKMILEYAQLLSTAHKVLDGIKVNKGYVLGDYSMDSNIYKATHINHPSSIWVRESKENYLWLHRLWVSLMEEYTYRYEKIHSCNRLKPFLHFIPKNIDNGKFTQPTPAMPEKYKVKNDSLQSYKNYYKYGKVHLHSWKKRDVPDWIV